VANATGHVLVVEDNPALLGVVALSLRNAGLEVTTAETGVEAWQILQENLFDLVVTDFNMPGMTGGDLCAKMREHESYTHTPIVLLTALSEDFQREHDLGAMDVTCVIGKPFSPRDVTNQVLEILRQVPERSRETTVAGSNVPPSRMPD